MTGEDKVSAQALLTYFKPLLNWLVTENVRQGEILGWPDFGCTFEGLSRIDPAPNSYLSLFCASLNL